MKLTVGKQIGLGFVLQIGLIILLAAVGYLGLRQFHHNLDVMTATTENELFVLEKTVDHLIWMQKLEEYLLGGEAFDGQLDDTQCDFGKWLYSRETRQSGDAEFQKRLVEIEEPHRRLHRAAQTMMTIRETDPVADVSELYFSQIIPALREVRQNVEELRQYFDGRRQIQQRKMVRDTEIAEASLGGLGLLAIILGIGAAWLISRRIVTHLQNVVKTLNESSHLVASASEQVAASSQQLAEGGTQQAAAIEETSSTLEETAAMARQNFENTKYAAQLSQQTKEAADKGNGEMQEMVRSMTELKRSSDQIAKIIKVIDDIAFQTNILALNAAVEAARAGEAGMGFAVVAEEVRNLASRSAQAAKDTAEMIDGNIRLSAQGMGVTERVRDALTDITVQAKKVNELLDEITAASQEQTQGIAQINKAIDQMGHVVQQNAATAQESASAAEELSHQAIQLRDAIGTLIELIQSRGGRRFGVSARGGVMTSSNAKRVATESSPVRSPERNNNTTYTKVVTAEEVIPLEADTDKF